MVKKAKDSIAEIQEQAKEPIDKEAILQDAIVSQIIKQLAPEQEPQESQIPQVIHNVDFRPIIKLNGNRLITVKNFQIVQGYPNVFQYTINIFLPHSGEINRDKILTKTDKRDILQFEFRKHIEIYTGTFLSTSVQWLEDENGKSKEPMLGLRFTGDLIQQ